MELHELMTVAQCSEKALITTHQAYNKYIYEVAQATEKYNSYLVKNINNLSDKKDMGLEEYFNKTLNKIGDIYTDTKDFLNYEKAKIYHIDAEKYKFIGDKETYNHLKKKCVETFNKLETEEFINKFKESMGSYLIKKNSK